MKRKPISHNLNKSIIVGNRINYRLAGGVDRIFFFFLDRSGTYLIKRDYRLTFCDFLYYSL